MMAGKVGSIGRTKDERVKMKSNGVKLKKGNREAKLKILQEAVSSRTWARRRSSGATSIVSTMEPQ